MKYLSQYTEAPISEMLTKYKAFFAFGMDQFEKAKDPNIPQADYTHVFQGMYAPKANAQAILTEYAQICKAGIEQDLEENGLYNIILRELNNHECYYTGDHQSALEALDAYPGVTEALVLLIFRNKTNPKYEVRPSQPVVDAVLQ